MITVKRTNERQKSLGGALLDALRAERVGDMVYLKGGENGVEFEVLPYTKQPSEEFKDADYVLGPYLKKDRVQFVKDVCSLTQIEVIL